MFVRAEALEFAPRFFIVAGAGEFELMSVRRARGNVHELLQDRPASMADVRVRFVSRPLVRRDEHLTPRENRLVAGVAARVALNERARLQHGGRVLFEFGQLDPGRAREGIGQVDVAIDERVVRVGRQFQLHDDAFFVKHHAHAEIGDEHREAASPAHAHVVQPGFVGGSQRGGDFFARVGEPSALRDSCCSIHGVISSKRKPLA
ncbi:hypothetical protein BYI23_B002390 [Burkholderia sp. YI23]|nr:hypothetical protein BYI23_B002390 [Burkholderia sp. YI23]